MENFDNNGLNETPDETFENETVSEVNETDGTTAQGNPEIPDTDENTPSEKSFSEKLSDIVNSTDDEPTENNFKPIEYTPITVKQPASKGIKVFAVLMALIILLSCVCFVGYRIGLNDGKSLNALVDMDLQSKPENTEQFTPAQLYNEYAHSVVNVNVYSESGNYVAASGVVYSDEGYIIINDHIYANITSPQFKITDNEGNEYDADFVAGDTRTDLAVIKVDGLNIKPAVFGNSAELIYGENVSVISRPYGVKKNTVFSGIVSATSCRATLNGSYNVKLIQTNIELDDGSSGGALFNMYGQVVGITSTVVSGMQNQGLSYAVPTTAVKEVVDALISDGGVNSRSKIGISYTEVNSVTAKISQIYVTGIYVASVSDDSDLYGKVDVGNIIIELNGEKLKDAEPLLDFIEQSNPGDEFEIKVFDVNTAKTKTVTGKLLPDEATSSYKE